MHILKNKILLALAVALPLVFVACAGSSDSPKSDSSILSNAPQDAQEKNARVQERAQDKQAALEAMFAHFLESVRNGAEADTLYDMLTDPSEEWLNELERHAKSYDADALDTCQFYEAYAILLYRLYEREHLWVTDEDHMLFLILSKSGMLERFTNLNLGPMKVKNDRGSIGLAKSPEVPVMLFEWDDTVWKLDLPATVPLITKGIESIAVKKNWTGRKLALYWLEKEYHMTYSRLDDSLFDPIGF